MYRSFAGCCALYCVLLAATSASAQTQIPEITINALPSELATPPLKQPGLKDRTVGVRMTDLGIKKKGP